MTRPAPERSAPPTADDVAQAAERLAGRAVRTPLLRSPALDRATGARVFLKAENLQRTGSFKFRGAYNRLAAMSPEARARGVVAFSSGNHAQGVAEAARLFGAPATIVMPRDTPAAKVEGTRVRGARVVFYDRAREDREAIAAAIARETGAALTPSYDHPDVIAGQGVVGREIAEDLDALGERADLLVCCVGGGGLVAGIALALGVASPATRLYAAEPLGFDDHRRSLLAGRRVANAGLAGSFCDALLAPTPGSITFAINRTRLAGGVAVSDAEVAAAMGFAFRTLKIVLEPGGAVALAATLAGKLDVRGRTVVVVATGGNVDADVFARAIGGVSPRA